MTGKKGKSVTHRPVGNKRQGKDISQDPAFQRLKEIFNDMTDEEKRRTVNYLEDEISPERDK